MSEDGSLLGDAELKEKLDLSSLENTLADDFGVVEESTVADTVFNALRSPLAIAKEVSEKFSKAKEYFSTIVESDTLVLRASVNIQYGTKQTNLKGIDALSQILREVLEINGEGGFSRPPLNTKEQMDLITELQLQGVKINDPYPKLNGEEREDTITPLSQAAQNNNIPLIEFLISQGAEITPAVLRSLSKSISFGIEEAVQIMNIFVSSGASINMYDELGGIMHTNFFHYEAHSKFLEFLLKSGLSTKITNKEGKTLLHVAVEATDHDQSSLLIRHGADLYLNDSEGKTPLDLANGDSFKTFLEKRFKEYQENQAKEPQVRKCPPLQKFKLGFTIEPREPTFRERFDALSDAEQAIVVEELKANPPGLLVRKAEAAAAESTNEYSEISILDINPQIKLKDARECMVIICDVGVSEPKGGFKGDASELGYTGHYYIGLGKLRDGEVSEINLYRGYNPAQRAVVERGIVKNEKQRLDEVKRAEKVFGKGKLKVEKAIPLTEVQYSIVKSFSEHKEEHPGTYIGGWHDCITFTQDILDKVGLNHFKVGDLVSLGQDSKLTLATVSAGLRGLDNRIVEGACAEEVAGTYNVDLGRIEALPARLGEMPKFRIIPIDQYLKIKDQGAQ